MDGEIGVDSVPGAGSTFWFTARLGFPDVNSGDLAEPAENWTPRRPWADRPDSDASVAGGPVGASSAHVLIVEDNDLNQEVAAGLLKGAGMSVDIAANGAVAVRMVQRALSIWCSWTSRCR